MATSKYELAERLRKEMQPRLTPNTKVSQQEAELAVSDARDKLLKDLIWNRYYQGESLRTDAFTSEFGFDEHLHPTYDSKRKLWYLWCPAQPLDLPKNSGIVSVGIVGENDILFVRTSPRSKNLFRNLPASNLPRQTYWLEGDKIFFGKDLNEQSCLFVKMVAEAKSVDSREFLPMPPDMELEVIELAKQKYINQPPADPVNDGYPNPS